MNYSQLSWGYVNTIVSWEVTSMLLPIWEVSKKRLASFINITILWVTFQTLSPLLKKLGMGSKGNEMTLLPSQWFRNYENKQKKGPSLNFMNRILTPVFLLWKGFKRNRGSLLKWSLKLFITKAAQNGKERSLFINRDERVKPQSGHKAPRPELWPETNWRPKHSCEAPL